MLYQYSQYTFPALIIIGIIIGVFIILKKIKKIELDKKSYDRLIVIFAAAGLAFYIGARLFDDLFHFLSGEGFHHGGITFLGGMISAVLVLVILMLIFLKPIRRKFFVILNIVVIGITIGHSIGRIGCFTAGCCYGKITTSWIGINFKGEAELRKTSGGNYYIHLFGSDGYEDLFKDKVEELGYSINKVYTSKVQAEYVLNEAKNYAETTKLIPTQLIEALFLLLLFFLLFFIKNLQSHLYLIIYGIYRFFIEFLRNDNRGSTLIGISPSQLISIIIVIVGVVSLIWYLHLKKKDLVE